MASVFKKARNGPWIIKWFDADGKRREKSSRTTDKRAADRIAAQLEAGVALRREGVVDRRLDRYASENARHLETHMAAYLAHLKHAQRSARTIDDARYHLEWIKDATRSTRLSDLTLDSVERALSLLQAEGLSARTVNHHGGSVRAFLGWCVKSGRLESNPLRFLPKQVEATDRRRVRRALTDEEVDRLLAIAERRGRKLWYMLALWAGLRLSELKVATWGDVDFRRGVLVVRHGKANRVDEVPIHPELAPELLRARPQDFQRTARIFPTAVTNATRRKDFVRAGIPEIDEDGLHADLHSLRTTLGTKLARAGVAPQVAQQIMRHSDYRTTIRFYTRLELSDTSLALAQLTTNKAPGSTPHHQPHQSEHVAARQTAG